MIENPLVQIKSKLGDEFRRFSLPRPEKSGPTRNEDAWSYEAFVVLLRKLHHLDDTSFTISYTDPKDGEQLPLTNNDNFQLSLIRAKSILRILISQESESLSWTEKKLKISRDPFANAKSYFFGNEFATGSYNPNLEAGDKAKVFIPESSLLKIGKPKNFRHVSTLIDTDQLPPTQRRVRLRQSEADGRTLGLFIRDGWNIRENDKGDTGRAPGIFISRIINGGLAESTGLLSVNDEVLEVNGIPVCDGLKTLDQVTDMMVANAADLIITIKTSNIENATAQKTGNSNRLQTPVSASAPSSPGNSLDRKTRHLREKRKGAVSSVFYVDSSETENEDQVITYVK